MPRTVPCLAKRLWPLLLAPMALVALAQASYALHPDAARCYQLRHSDPEAAARLATQRLSDSSIAAPDRLVFEACRAISRAITGDAQAAREGVAAVEALLASHPMPPGFELRALSNAGATLQLAGDIAGALDAYDRALRAAEREDAWEAQVTTLVNIGLLHGEELAAYHEAEALFARAAQINDAHPGRRADVPYNRGLNYLRMGRPEDAQAQFEQAQALARDAGEGIVSARADAELLALRAEPAARAGLQRLAERQRAGGDVSGAARSLLLQARLSLQGGDARQALADADRSLAMLPGAGFAAERRDALELRTAALVAQGRWREAYLASRDAHDEQIGRLRANQLDSMARLQATLVDERNREDLARARQEGEISALRASHERRQRNVALAALATLILAGVGFIAYQRRVNRRLRRLSTRDSLTKLLNRHAAGKRLEAMVPARVDAGDARMAVFLIDIDRFKAINDRHGHDAGDVALLAVAGALVEASGPEAVVARWGGEEFLVGLAGLDARGAARTAERLRMAVAGAAIGGGVGPVTVSIGFACAPVFPPTDGGAAGPAAGHWPDAVVLADRALYAAKRSSRDAWVGLWGRAGSRAAIDDALDAPADAIAGGDLQLAASRPGFTWPPADAG